MIKINKKQIKLTHDMNEEDSYVNASMAERVLMIWDLTAEIWSLQGEKHVKQRLQRHVTNLIKE